jgi:hypothetical protein
VDDAPVAPAAEGGLAGSELDAACRTSLALPSLPAIAGPAWWDANAPARRVSYVRRASSPLPPPPWPARRALDFCAELALALAPVHEAGAAHGALRPEAVTLRPDGGPLVQLPGGGAGAADDVHGLGILLLRLLADREPSAGLVVAGEVGPAAAAANLLQGLLADDPAARPGSARQVGERLAAIAAEVPGVSEADEPRARRQPRRRARIAAALVLLAIAGGAGAYLVSARVGPPGPALSPVTVSVPTAPAVTP